MYGSYFSLSPFSSLCASMMLTEITNCIEHYGSI